MGFRQFGRKNNDSTFYFYFAFGYGLKQQFFKYPYCLKPFHVGHNAMRFLLFISIFLIFASCQSHQAKIDVVGKDTIVKFLNHELGTLSIDLPPTWKPIRNDSLPHTPDMTARYWIRTGTGDTMFLMQGFSAWDLSEDDSNNYNREQDTLFGQKAMKFSSKAETNNCIGVFVDSIGEVKPVGYYGFTAYTRGLQDSSVDSFWNIVKTVRLHPFK
jgi:hypothetical protein